MKKVLSLILSILILAGCIPLFCVLASEETKTLPTNMFSGYKSPSAKTITPSTNITVGGSYEAGTAAALAMQWGKADGSGNNGDPYSPINAGYYQLDFDVTVSEDISSDAFLYPEFHSNATVIGLLDLVGVRYNLSTPGDTETAHNYINGTTSEYAYPSANGSAILKAGSYRYSYVFKSSADRFVNYVVIMLRGLTAGSVKIENANIFSLASTDWEEFYYKPTELTRFMVAEEGKVFQRIYGYRPVGDTTVGTRRSLSAKLGGKYYDMYFKGGNNYYLNFDFRFPKGSTTLGDLKYAPLVDFYETRTLDYTEEYSAIKQSAGSTTSDSAKYVVQTVTPGTTQVMYQDNINGYSYFYAAAGQSTRCRRINSGNITTFTYSNSDGVLLYSATSYTSSLGRDAKKDDDIKANNNWLSGTYSIKATQSQSVADAYLTAKSKTASYAQATRYVLSGSDNTTWVYQSGYNSYFVPSAQNAYVALGIGYLYSGYVYDFDDITITGDFDEALPIKYENIDGSENTTSIPSGNSAKLLKNADGSLTASLDFSTFDGSYIFKGWYEDDKFISSNLQYTFSKDETDASQLTAKILVMNAIEGDPGFENYVNETLRVQPSMQNIAPYSDKWGLYSGFSNSKGGAGYENGDWPWTVNAFSGTITDYYLKDDYDFATSTTAQTKVEYTVTPYEGNTMLGAAVKSRSMIRKLQNLKPNTEYTLSFYVNYPSETDYIKTVQVADTYDGYNNSTKNLDENLTKIYSTYNETEDFTVDIEKIRNWGKISLTFTTDEDDTELYMHIAFGSKDTSTNASRIYIDNLVCAPNIIGYTGNSIRAGSKELPQALRYKFYMNNENLKSLIGMDVKEIGLLAIDNSFLGTKELVIDGEYELYGETRTPSVGIVNENDIQTVEGNKNNFFTAALYNIGCKGGTTNYKKYATDFSVRPYIKLQNSDSGEVVYYGNTVNASIFDVVHSIYTKFSSQSDKLVADGILSVPAAKNEYKNWEPKNGFFKFKDTVTDYEYSFAVVGDPQVTTGYYPEYMHYTYDWIVDNKNEKSTQYVITLGDLTQNSTDAEYAVIESGLQKVDNAGIYQTILRGNHDSVSSYDKNITKAEYGSYLSGSYDNTMKSTYHIVTLGGTKYLMLNLDYYPSTAVVDWAADIVNSNADCKVILNTHGLLNYDMNLLTDASVIYMHNNLILKYENISMVLCGHHEADGPKYKTVTGENGNKIIEMMINPQGIELRNGEAYGFVATLYFKNNGKSVEVEYYSTVREAYYKNDYQFTFELE